MRVVEPREVEAQLDQLDGSVSRQLRDNGHSRHQAPLGDEDSVVETADHQWGKIVESAGKRLHDLQELLRLEVSSGRLPAWAALGWQLTVEVVEEGSGSSNGATLGHEAWGMSRASRSAMRGSACSWTAARKAGDTAHELQLV